MLFPATVNATGKNTTGIPVPSDVMEHLAAGKRPAVTVTINGYSYRTTVASMSGEYMLSVSAEVRELAGITAGDPVDVSIELDTAPREVVMPQDFLDAIMPYPDATTFYDALSYSNKRKILLSIEGAKMEETRRRRIEKAVQQLRDSKV